MSVSSNKIRNALLVLAPVLLLGYGLVALFEWRFAQGDVYPAYSTLRADALGAQIFYESLRELPEVQASRNTERLDLIQPDESTAIFLLGVPPRWIPQRVARQVSALALEGGRVVVSFAHVAQRRTWEDEEDEEEALEREEEAAEDAEEALEEDEEEPQDGVVSTNRVAGPPVRWGVAFHFDRDDEEDVLPSQAVPLEDASTYGPVTWKSALFFTPGSNAWNILYARDGQPVLIERSWGRGSLVLVADSYFLSNEALLKERQSALLARLVGSCRRIVFDESHLGIQHRPGLMNLVWKYRLQGLAAGLVVLALLFLWKSFARFLPLDPEAPEEEVVSGMTAHEGYVQLLRRTVPVHDLPRVCLEEWEKTSGHDPRNRKKPARMREALRANEALADTARAKATTLYATLQNIAKERE